MALKGAIGDNILGAVMGRANLSETSYKVG
jgi:hypothetical protein